MWSRFLVCLICGALTGAQDPNRSQRSGSGPGPGARRPGDQRPGLPVLQQPAAAQQQQQQQQHHAPPPLQWRFPAAPAEEGPRFPPDFELRAPPAAQSVSAACRHDSVRVEVNRDLLGIGKPVLTRDVSLGGCPPSDPDPDSPVLVFESELHGCGSHLLMTEDAFIYVFMLMYNPSPLGPSSPIVRTRDVSVSIQCHYQRKHSVSAGQVAPSWSPFSVTRASEESLYFSLRLMTDDWRFPRPSSQFVLGEVMRLEASVKPFLHVPLRLYVHSCVATVIPNVDTVPRYVFLGNRGCLFDSQLTGSSSKFLPRSRNEKLQFEVEAFRFQQDHSGVIHITCTLRAGGVATPVDGANKACSFAKRWTEASGVHQACSCCDSDCGNDDLSHLTAQSEVEHLEQEAVVGPIVVKDRPLL